MNKFFPLVLSQDNRTHLNTKDEMLQNCFLEISATGNIPTIIKRPGFFKLLSLSIAGGLTGTRGGIWSAAHNKYYIVVNNVLVSVDAAFTTVTAITITINTTVGRVYFEHFKDGSTPVVMLHIPGATSQLFKITNGSPSTATAIASNYPTTAVGAGIALDNYYFVLKRDVATNTCTIHNCDLTTPSTWNALNYIAAYMYPDNGVTLARFANTIAAMKDTSIEFFYDAGNINASPLSPVQNAALNIGCAAAESVITSDGRMTWVSRDNSGGLGVHSFTGTLEKISTPYIDRILASTENIINSSNVSAINIDFEGHNFYILTIEGSGSSVPAIAGVAVAGVSIAGGVVNTTSFKRTLVYDFTTKLWSEWTSLSGLNQSSFFANVAISGSSSYSNILVLDKSTGDIYEMSPQPLGNTDTVVYKDGTNLIQVKMVTRNIDFGTQRKKKLNSIEFVGDKSSSSTNLSIQYSDDDYITWSNSRTVDLSQRAILRNLGMFRRRAFQIIHNDNTPLRLEGFELDIEPGSS